MRNCLSFRECTVVSKNGKIGKPYFGISLFLVTLLVPTLSDARCYSRWYYPYPQNCGRGGTGIRMALKTPEPSAMKVQLLPPAPDDDHSWYVEITKLPDEDSDIREVGIEKLKQQLK